MFAISVACMGAPTVFVEKLPNAQATITAMRKVEKELSRKFNAIIPLEAGGINATLPLVVAAQMGLPVVDGDGMGRAFPEMQMCTWSIYGHREAPGAMADEKGNIVVIRNTPDDIWLERIARSVVVAMGAAAGLATQPMRGDFVKRAAVPNTITQALNLGRAVLHAHQTNADPVQTVINQERGKLLMTAKITDLQRHLKGGFAVGHMALEGFGDFLGDTGRIDLQNEFLVFWRDDKVEVCTPDLIVVLDSDTGLPITTEMLRYGQRVAVLGLPAHPLMRSPEALKVVGPAAFGYSEITFNPMEDM